MEGLFRQITRCARENCILMRFDFLLTATQPGQFYLNFLAPPPLDFKQILGVNFLLFLRVKVSIMENNKIDLL